MIDTTTLHKDIDKETARRAFYWTSFSPEKRGDSVIESYIQVMDELALYITDNAKDERQQAVAQEVFDNLREKYKTKTLAMLAAKSRCMSSMITGPANFPVRRAEKANNAERKRSDEFIEFSDNMEKYALKNLNAVYSTQEKQLTELEQQKNKLFACEEAQDRMKTANKFIRKNDIEGLKKAEPKHWEELIKPDFCGRLGFASYQLTNNNANIKRIKQRVADLETKSQAAEEHGTVETQMNGLIVVKNFEEDRLQLLFDDKPEDEVRKVLKSNGFRWAPSKSAWQRKLTGNAWGALTRRVLTTDQFKQYA